ncbi:MAG: hypothetical protein ACOX6W_01745 [Lentisphaeria bacterium]
MARKTSSNPPQERKTRTVEISSAKHRRYKLYAVKNDMTIKELVEKATDDLISSK